ncbi:MAG TPA: enoyl-CoA hydratase-related protein, partial [Gammaproteobacteria bacterium]
MSRPQRISILGAGNEQAYEYFDICGIIVRRKCQVTNKRHRMSIEMEVRQGVASLYLNNPPVNALSADMRVSLYENIAALEKRDDILAIVIAARGRCFCGGA